MRREWALEAPANPSTLTLTNSSVGREGALNNSDGRMGGGGSREEALGGGGGEGVGLLGKTRAASMKKKSEEVCGRACLYIFVCTHVYGLDIFRLYILHT